MARALVDYWRHEGECSFGELLDIYCESSPRVMSPVERQRAGMTITPLLKKYGHKLGERGSKAPWKFGTRPLDPKLIEQISVPKAPEQPSYMGRKLFRAGDVVRYRGSNDPAFEGQLATIDDRVFDTVGTPWGPMNGDDGYWPITWHDAAGKPGDRCGSRADNLELVTAAIQGPFSEQIFQLQQRIYNDQATIDTLKEQELRFRKVVKVFETLSDDEKAEMTELCCKWEEDR